MNGRTLYRSRGERVIAGVAGGLADYLDLDPSLVRVVWAILALFSGGAFLLIYIIMALVVPEEPWEGYVAPPGPSMPPPPPGMTAPVSGTDAGAGTTAPMADLSASAGASTAAGAPAPPPPGAWPPGSDWRTQRAAWRAQRRAQRAAWRASGHDGGQTAGLVFGLLLLVVGLVFLVPIAFPAFDVGRFWPVLLIGLGVVLVIAAMRPRRWHGP